MKPTLEPKLFFPRKDMTGSCGIKKAVETVFRHHSSISSKSDALKLISNAWNEFVETFEISDENAKRAAFDAVKETAHQKIKENGFANLIPSADKLADAIYNNTSETELDSNEEDVPAPVNHAEEAPAEAPVPATDKDKDGNKPADSEGNAQPPKGKPASSESNSKTPKDKPADSEKKPKAPKDKSADSEKKATNSKFKLSPVMTAAIWIIVGGMIASFIWALAISGFGMRGPERDTGAIGANGDAITLGTGTIVAEDMVSYHTEEFMILDSEKSKITICRSEDKNVGYNLTLNMSRQYYTDDSGQQYLCYTGSSANAFVEIVAPIYPEGSKATSHKLALEDVVAKRDKQFGQVEIGWNGEVATLTLLVTGQIYYLDLA